MIMKIILLFFVLITFSYSSSCECNDGRVWSDVTVLIDISNSRVSCTNFPPSVCSPNSYELINNCSEDLDSTDGYTGSMYKGKRICSLCNEPFVLSPPCPDGAICGAWLIIDSSHTIECPVGFNLESYGSKCKTYERCVSDSNDTNTTSPDTNTTSPDTNTTSPDTNTTSPDTNTTSPDANGDDGSGGDDGSCDSPCGSDNSICINQYYPSEVDGSHYDHTFQYVECGSCNLLQTDPYGGPCPGTHPDGDDVPPNDNNDTNHDDDTLSCPHPATSPFGYPFQSITSSIWVCIDTYNSHGGGDSEPCTDGVRVACYYHTNNDTNSSNSDNYSDNTSDSNSSMSGSDNNLTTSPTDSNLSNPNNNIENKLDAINNSLSTTGAINNTLAGISQRLNNFSVLNHNDLKSLNNSLSSKLDAIRNAINNKPISNGGTDMTITNQHLQNIEDSLNYDGSGFSEGESEDINSSINLSYNNDDTTAILGDSNDALKGQFKTSIDGFLDKLKTLSVVNIPHGSCGCTDPTISFSAFGKSYNRTILICTPYQTILGMLKPVLWFIAFFMLLVNFYRSF